MTWTATVGLGLLLVSIVILASFMPGFWDDDPMAGSLPGSTPPLNVDIRHYLRRRQLRTSRWAMACGGALLLASIFLILHTKFQPPPPPNIQVVVPPSASSATVIPTGPEGGATVSIPWSELWLSGLCVLILLVGGVVGLASNSRFGRVMGGTAIAVATVSSPVLLDRGLKIELAPEIHFAFNAATEKQISREVRDEIETLKPLIVNDIKTSLDGKIEFHFDKPTLRAEFNAYLNEVAAPQPEHVVDVGGFALGSSALPANVDRSLADICADTNKREHRDGLLLLVGETDRVPLGSAAQLRYESNLGLARARAEAVKSAIIDTCKAPPVQILAIVSGPQTTPDVKIQPTPTGGFADNRKVEVWAIWTWHDSH